MFSHNNNKCKLHTTESHKITIIIIIQVRAFKCWVYIIIYVFVDSCNRTVADIMFVLDSSGSLGTYNFQILKSFVINVTKALDIGRNLTQVGVITFNNYPLLRIPLDRYQVKTNLLNAINAIPYFPGKLKPFVTFICCYIEDGIKSSWSNLR